MDRFLIQFFRLDLFQCYFPIATAHLLSLFGRNIDFCGFQFQESQDMLVCKLGKGSDWCFIARHCFQWPQPSVGNVTVYYEDLQINALHFVSKLFQLYLDLTQSIICNYMASTACPGTVYGFPVIIPVNFISFTCLHVVSRDFLKTRFTKCTQIQFI